MKIVYIANIRLPTEKAHGIQIMKMCEAFAEKGIDLELIIPSRRNDLMVDPFIFYGIKRIFQIKKMPCLDILRFNFEKIGFLISTLTFLTAAKIYLAFRHYDFLYARERLVGIFFNDYILEVHALPAILGRFSKRFFRKAKLLIALTEYMRHKLLDFGMPENRIIVLPDAVDITGFSISISQKEARDKLNLPANKKIVLYTGSFFFYPWKGVDILLEAARRLGPEYLAVLVGGHPHEIEKVKKEYNLHNILVVPYVSHGYVPIYLKAADVLVIPNKKGNEISEGYTSPLKLFEYMASGRPIVSSDLQSLREVITEKEAVFFKPNDPADLAEKIKAISNNKELEIQLVENAYEKVKKYTWQNRTAKLLKHLHG